MSTWLLLLLVVSVNYVIWGTVGVLRLCDETIGRAVTRVRWLVGREWQRRGPLPVRRRWRGRRAGHTTGGRHRSDDGGGHAAGDQAGRQQARRRAASDLDRRRWGRRHGRRLTVGDVGVLMAAHNEELVIERSLRAISALVPVGQVHVVSDCSTDGTVELARRAGAHVIETETNVGKAGALQEGITTFALVERFEAVMILDADTQLDPRYFEVALPLLDDPEVVAVAGCAETRWHPEDLSLFGAMIVAHRQRIYTLTQRLLKFGQTWRGLSATHIVPGFASIYRSRVLENIDINPRGLVIEDFNMTFEVHAKKLGRIAFAPGARAYTQDPSRYGDYVRQTKRWALGLWQTLRRYHPRPGVFSLMLAVLIAELLSSSIFCVVLPLVLLTMAGSEIGVLAGADGLAVVRDGIEQHLSMRAVGLGVLLPDYALTCCVALLEKRPRYLYLGLFFMVMRVTDAVIALYSLPCAWRESSNGRWVSPTRRAIPAEVPSHIVA